MLIEAKVSISNIIYSGFTPDNTSIAVILPHHPPPPPPAGARNVLQNWQAI